ncbi:uncharacterized protein CEXT_167441 [Caerostris extrusa]|uniref:Uncharacterized protein n=1 Tax=Caerostris extrusa TaxID=172846 RepID=A0AAV4W819_CAEEX|nr:uncharacterized protein CEXT_167441 [Caerostris extrusa]
MGKYPLGEQSKQALFTPLKLFFDAIVVLVAFGLDVAFFIAPSKVSLPPQKKSCQTLLAFIRRKIQSDHKVDLLILKVEDLEHEVAYLKEKLKKTEKEPLFMKRRKAKESSSLPFPLPSSISIPHGTHMLANLSVINSIDQWCSNFLPYQILFHPLTFSSLNVIVALMFYIELKNKVTLFAENAATIIVDEALLLASHIRSPSDLPPTRAMSPTRNKGACKLRRRPDGSIESGYGSASSSMNWSKSRPNTKVQKSYFLRSEEEKQSAPLAAIRDTLKCPESSPESGYGSGGSAHNPGVEGVSPGVAVEPGKLPVAKPTKLVGTVFLFSESSEEVTTLNEVNMKVLDEKSEIERIRHVEFNPNKLEKVIVF